ncbi:hypothetical protein DFH08DRAFT_957896 [Mycena albidolilacea]|uniref:Uncharacterized protein n=1 Tax=Mycena albidolilacea TaxID=1033008 RepID=A0AAD7A862_9AGAR|nr:hypothetical protein DFH08DRAFT_957896 [Mycena albidolilacea]
MSSPKPCRCSPPFHADPNTTKATAKVFYLVTSPAAGSKRSVYPSWTSAQRASEGKARGGAVKFTAWDDRLPAWHACCDAGEHEHDALPPRTPTPPTIPTRLPRAAPSSIPPSPTYAVRGSGAIHSSLDAALADFQAAATRGPATLYTAEDPRVAAHVAAGRSPEDAIALVSRSFVEGEAASASTRNTMNNIHDIPDDEVDEWQDDDGDFTYGNMIDGAVPIDISHGGGEMQDMAQALSDDLHGKARRKRQDTRYRSDVVQRRVLGFRAQMKEMVDAYMAFSAAQGEHGMARGPVSPSDDMVENEFRVMVVDVFDTYTVDAPILSTDTYIASCLVGQGLIPCSPWKPKQAVSIRVLEMFRLARLRCPALGVQAWIKTLADLHGTAFKPYSTQRFTICFDLYLEILDNAEKRLKGEDKLIFAMLLLMDGNDSLKCILRKDKGFNEDGVAHRGDSERADSRAADAGGDYLMFRERVDRWTKKRLAEEVGIPISDEPENSSGCEERWKNLTEELTAKMWGIFDETGIFVALCRHGFVLLVADMVRSGELAKYPLAIVNALLDAFGADLGIGYDIGCGHSTTIRHSPLGPKAAQLNLKMLVGAFHGHAHNRKCQLDYLATYVLGLGLEDLEGAERLFSRSNGLSRSTYANLSTFLVNNYKQAIEILDTEESLKYAMEQAGVTEHMLKSRIQEEKAYLNTLLKEPQEETDQMEYYQLLVNLADRKEKFDEAFGEGSTANGNTRRHARENYNKVVEAVQATERRLSIEVRWTSEDKEWTDTAELVVNRRYRRAVDSLEALVVKRLLELTKVNQSGLGYKVRKHIAKALQVRSKAIRSALQCYNSAALALDPPRQHLSWEEVIDYAFLADFDILRDPTGNTTIRAWADPAARQLLDSYHKLKRAKEEIQ